MALAGWDIALAPRALAPRQPKSSQPTAMKPSVSISSWETSCLSVSERPPLGTISRYLVSLPSQAARTSTISPISQSRSVTLAAIAGGPQRLMDAYEIIVHREQRHGVRMVLDLL